MKSYYILLLLLLLNFTLLNALVIKEEFYDGNMKFVGEKKYLYDENLNIIKITSDTGAGFDVYYRYGYENNTLKAVEEFRNTARAQYGIFMYKDNNIYEKHEYTNEEELIMIHRYFFENDLLVKKEMLYPDGGFIGKQMYIYKNNRLIQIEEYNENNTMFLTKKFEYGFMSNKIDTIKFYTSESTLIRIIKRKYDKTLKADENFYGLKNNFWDFK